MPAAAAAETSLLQLLMEKVPKDEILGPGISYTIQTWVNQFGTEFFTYIKCQFIAVL
jgi:hypothetical protein